MAAFTKGAAYEDILISKWEKIKMNAEAYRPRVLDEVIGHEESKQALKS